MAQRTQVTLFARRFDRNCDRITPRSQKSSHNPGRKKPSWQIPVRT